MALTEKHAQALRDLRTVEKFTSVEAGRAQMLIRCGEATSAESADLRALLKRYEPQPPPSDSNGPAPAGDTTDALLEALDKYPEADGRVLRALIHAGVRPEKLDRAVQLASAQFDEPPTSEQAAQEAAQLRQDAPDMFGGSGGPSAPARPGPGDCRPGSQPPAGRSRGSAQQAGAALARDRGWSKPKTDT